MPHDLQLAMRIAVERGPGHCPPDLFAGTVDAIVSGLKAHANCINHARHAALEDTYPRTRELIGQTAFHAAATAHLGRPATRRKAIALIGHGFSRRLDGLARDIAEIEWAWLQSHGAADASPFDLAAIRSLTAEALAAAEIVRHPSVRLVDRVTDDRLDWDGTQLDGPFVLVTRPNANVFVTGLRPAAASALGSLNRPVQFGRLLQKDAASASLLLTAGALTLSSEILP